MRRKVKCLFISICLLFTSVCSVYAASGSLNNFSRIKHYNGQFSDVPSSAWFYPYVKDAFEYGFVSGRTSSTFAPDGNITIAETLVLACQLNSIYYNKTINQSNTNPWYKPYVDYAISNGIIGSRDYSNYSAMATRAQFAVIMTSSLPSSALSAKGNITSIPDVLSSASYANAVYKLYNAGILAGSDEFGTFHPKSNIKRSEVAVIVLNIAEKSRRRVARLKPLPIFGQVVNGAYENKAIQLGFNINTFMESAKRIDGITSDIIYSFGYEDYGYRIKTEGKTVSEISEDALKLTNPIYDDFGLGIDFDHDERRIAYPKVFISFHEKEPIDMSHYDSYTTLGSIKYPSTTDWRSEGKLGFSIYRTILIEKENYNCFISVISGQNYNDAHPDYADRYFQAILSSFYTLNP